MQSVSNHGLVSLKYELVFSGFDLIYIRGLKIHGSDPRMGNEYEIRIDLESDQLTRNYNC